MLTGRRLCRNSRKLHGVALRRAASRVPHDEPHSHPTPQVRKGQAEWPILKDEFLRRFKRRFFDPKFDAHAAEIDALAETAWKAYCDSRKAPQTRAAGPEFADPTYELSIEWLSTREAIRNAMREHGDSKRSSRVLLICGAARNDKTCPGEMSKTFRLVQFARDASPPERADLGAAQGDPSLNLL